MQKIAQEIEAAHPKGCACKLCSPYIYVCQTCFLEWEQKPGEAPTLLASIEEAKERLEDSKRKQVDANNRIDVAMKDAYAQQWWDARHKP
jgi:NifB/MoaA-like Fe-S oxidoreductase